MVVRALAALVSTLLLIAPAVAEQSDAQRAESVVTAFYAWYSSTLSGLADDAIFRFVDKGVVSQMRAARKGLDESGLPELPEGCGMGGWEMDVDYFTKGQDYSERIKVIRSQVLAPRLATVLIAMINGNAAPNDAPQVVLLLAKQNNNEWKILGAVDTRNKISME
jgi:hypothetical protein